MGPYENKPEAPPFCSWSEDISSRIIYNRWALESCMDKLKAISTYGKEKIVAYSSPFYFFHIYFLSVSRHCANEADGQRYTLKTV